MRVFVKHQVYKNDPFDIIITRKCYVIHAISSERSQESKEGRKSNIENINETSSGTRREELCFVIE